LCPIFIQIEKTVSTTRSAPTMYYQPRTETSDLPSRAHEFAIGIDVGIAAETYL